MTTPLRIAIACALAAAVTTAAAQPSAAKKELVKKLLEQQQSELESISRSMVERPAAQMLQAAAPAMQNVAPERREAVGKQIDAEVRKYVDESYALVRERALRIAPETIGSKLEESLSEEELRQLLAFYGSPLSKKYQQLLPESRDNFIRRLLTDSQPVVDPKLKALEAQIRAALAPPAGAASGAAPPTAARPRPAASRPAAPASQPR